MKCQIDCSQDCGNTLSLDQIKHAIVNYAYGYQIDPGLALAQANRESGFNPCCIGGDCERGLMQITPDTWSAFSGGVSFDNAFDVDYNLTTWGNYMVYLSGLFGGDVNAVLQAYNGGPGNVQRGTVSGAAQNYAASIIAAAPNVQTPAGNGASSAYVASSSYTFGSDGSGLDPSSMAPLLLIAAGVLVLLAVSK